MKAFMTRLSITRPGTKSNACSRSMPKIEQTRAKALTRSRSRHGNVTKPAKGYCYDNAFSESAFASLKSEVLSDGLNWTPFVGPRVVEFKV